MTPLSRRCLDREAATRARLIGEGMTEATSGRLSMSVTGRPLLPDKNKTGPKAGLVHDFWSGRRDLNPRPPVPQTGALPDCATPRERPQSSTGLLLSRGVGLSVLDPGMSACGRGSNPTKSVERRGRSRSLVGQSMLLVPADLAASTRIPLRLRRPTHRRTDPPSRGPRARPSTRARAGRSGSAGRSCP
jgi:hypothetical protein